MSPPHASAGSGHGWTPIPRLSPPSLGPHSVLGSTLGMLWSWGWISHCPDTPLHPDPACGEAAAPILCSPHGGVPVPAHITFNYPDTSRDSSGAAW